MRVQLCANRLSGTVRRNARLGFNATISCDDVGKNEENSTLCKHSQSHATRCVSRYSPWQSYQIDELNYDCSIALILIGQVFFFVDNSETQRRKYCISIK